MRSTLRRALVAALLSLALLPAARAETAFGIQVYPDARKDKLSDGYCQRVDASLRTVRCFRTSDDFAKVMAFYEKQGLAHTRLWTSLPQSMRDDFTKGKKKVMEWCRAGKDERCTEMMRPSVRIVSPWSDNLNLSPATPPEKYPAKDVLIFIRAEK